ncbi:hypothetical protein HMPREF1978_00763 [Actinomyces graevenitzii F0530]|uniref:Uncharacterized protein n=1 Tax=Actinomyces graevenitzii F0530 TaxID=1321817 RepID=U1Q4Q9_9ACTO|nr:hypothetical protein HMPREF1978_00763 [Actinomyces graevenitzii F0530]
MPGCGLRAVAMVLVGHAYCAAGRPLGAGPEPHAATGEGQVRPGAR